MAAHEIGPNLPPPLYGLVNLYDANDDSENTARFATMILERWPEDESIKEILERQ
jgi:hypothetical protein